MKILFWLDLHEELALRLRQNVTSCTVKLTSDREIGVFAIYQELYNCLNASLKIPTICKRFHFDLYNETKSANSGLCNHFD